MRTLTFGRSLLVVAVAAAMLAATGSSLAGTAIRDSAIAAGSHGSRVVMTAKNQTLHNTILVTRSGRSLYSLSAERHGRFICTDSACLSLWKPLTVAKGTTPTGVRGLSTVKRPDGRIQVAYKGGPLYTFAGDHKRGDVKGNGFKDVGVWRVAVVGGGSSSPSPSSGGTYTSPYPYPYTAG
jgi:predicted lipoprotein with Yx(FWY)xxD motif